MTDDRVDQARRDVALFCRRSYERRLVSGRGGNISVRLPSDRILITPHGAALGFLDAEDVLEIGVDGRVVAGRGRPSAETHLHLAIYRDLPVRGIVHTHPIYATALAANRRRLEPITFETLFSLGKVPIIPQDTPTVLDTGPVVEALRNNNAVLLRGHGAVTIGESIEDAYLMAELLEEAAEMVAVADRDSKRSSDDASEGDPKGIPAKVTDTYALFSDDHIGAIVDLVNHDEEAQKRGAATGLTTRLGIRLDDNGKLHNLRMEMGRVTSVTHDEEVEFLISGPEAAWRQVFGGRIDPFVAVTQKRLKLRGDMGKLSRWYAPFCRVFELWREVKIVESGGAP